MRIQCQLCNTLFLQLTLKEEEISVKFSDDFISENNKRGQRKGGK